MSGKKLSLNDTVEYYQKRSEDVVALERKLFFVGYKIESSLVQAEKMGEYLVMRHLKEGEVAIADSLVLVKGIKEREQSKLVIAQKAMRINKAVLEDQDESDMDTYPNADAAVEALFLMANKEDESD